jgi:hypothetical protein
MKPIIFIKSYGVYNPGDVAGFEEEKCKELIALDVAMEPTKEDLEPKPIIQENKKLAPVQFLKAHGVYNPGDIAGFEHVNAHELCQGHDPKAVFLHSHDRNRSIDLVKEVKIKKAKGKRKFSVK